MSGNAYGSRTFPGWRHLVREKAPGRRGPKADNATITKRRQATRVIAWAYDFRPGYRSRDRGARITPCTSSPALRGPVQSVQVKFGISVSGVPRPIVIS